MKKYIYYIFILILFIPFGAKSQVQISVTGDPVFLHTVFNLTEAGSDYSNTVTSTSGPYIDISHSNGLSRLFGNFSWRVAINKSDIIWNSSLQIQVRRSGDGSGGSWFYNSISGGTNFQNVTDIPNNLFQGMGVRNDVPIQFRINNISVLVPADDYETTIYFTVYQQ
ncbi:MAG: hypothetical protein JXR31_14715 [Prolixibacteraceae bacterium]|nr:hypothetical protein [Prolixibacteraceae bacterium]MBN2775505.1 hypothetical protein [Prolixibacteraceae bacterium]